MTPIDEYYEGLKEPEQSVLLAINEIILSADPRLNLQWKYQMPFICLRKKMFCYSRIDKKSGELYISFADGYRMEHPELVSDGRKRFKLLYLNQERDLPIRTIQAVVILAIEKHK
tara:strand:+ start:6059 stop:6403 length:345 start_codon:yes stop_codon:yes gene_type:complete